MYTTATRGSPRGDRHAKTYKLACRVLSVGEHPMRGRAAAWAAPRGEKTLALRAQAILVEGSLYGLFSELWLARREMQRIINALWELDRLPSLNQAHQMFYKGLREKGFRAHQAKQMYKYALALVKAARRNSGSKPVLKRLTVRLDKYDASIDFSSWTVTVKLRDKVFRLKLLHKRSYLEKFAGRKWYEVIVKWLPDARIEVIIPFRFTYNPYKPRHILAVDLNLKTLTLYDGRSVRRIKTRYPEALRLKHLAEKVQKRRPYSWKRSGRLLKLVGSLHRRSAWIVLDWSRKIAKYLATKAKKMKAAIAVEDLEKLWHNASQKSSTLSGRLSGFAYRKLIQTLEAKAVEYNVPIVYVDPRNTSRACPRCGSLLSYY
jgi:putative transposase